MKDTCSTRAVRVAMVIALLWSAACAREAPPADASAPAAATAHQHHAPHGGILVELGEEFAQVELVLDPVAGSLTAYILDGEAEESVRVKQSLLTVTLEPAGSGGAEVLELPARADVLTGETVGDTSEFSVTQPSLIGKRSLKGHVGAILVKGEEFRDVRF